MLSGLRLRRIAEWLAQAGMDARKMIDRAPPVKLQGPVGERMRGAPGAAGQTGNGSSDSQVEAFDEGGLNATGEAKGAEGLAIVFRIAEQDVAADLDDAASAVAFDDLGIEQVGVNDPGAATLAGRLSPSSEMRSQGVEIE